MLKKIRRFASLFAVLVMLFLMFIPTVVSAEGAEVTNGTLTVKSSNTLYSVNGIYVSDTLCQSLSQFNVAVDENTIVEIVSCGSQNDATALAVTNQKDSSIMRSVFVAYDEQGEIRSIPVPNESRSGNPYGFGEEIDLYWNGSVVLVYAVLFNQYNSLGGKYGIQPINAQIRCKSNGTYSVSYMSLNYDCYGFECDYPSFVNRNEPNVLHRIRISQNSPVSNQMYYNSNPYRTDRVICINPGNGYHRVTYTLTINGVTDSWSESIPLNVV